MSKLHIIELKVWKWRGKQQAANVTSSKANIATIILRGQEFLAVVSQEVTYEHELASKLATYRSFRHLMLDYAAIPGPWLEKQNSWLGVLGDIRKLYKEG